MALQTPTTRTLSDQIISQLEGSFGQTIPILSKAFARVLAWVLAGAIVIVYKYAGFIFLQMFVAHASAEPTTINGKTVRPLVELGRLFGEGDPVEATQAQLMISVPVTNQTGTLRAGAQLLFESTRIIYRTVADVALNASSVSVQIQAIAGDDGSDGSGAIGNLQPGDKLSFANPQANIASTATVVSQVVTGADAEDIEHYRSRVVERVRNRPQGGAYADYRDWAIEVAGILNVYPYAGLPGQVDVYIEATPASSGSPDGIPTTPQKDAVKANIDLNNTTGQATRRPVNAAVNVLGISRTAFDIQISGLIPDTTETRADIEASLSEHLLSREPFIVGLSSLPRADRITRSGVGGIAETAANAAGATITAVDLLLLGAPIQASTLGQGQKAKLGTVTYL
jgi:uncharacterized phage protein gp47/JayE